MSVYQKEISAGKIWAKLPQHKKRVEQAKASILALLNIAPASYLSLSWGKQSLILAHMAYRLKADLPCVHWSGQDAEAIADFANTRDRFLKRWPINYTEFDTGDDDLLGNGEKYMQDNGLAGYIIGFSADESKGRNYTMTRNNQDELARVRGGWRCTPLRRWQREDYAAYIATYDLPMLEPYRKFGLWVRTSTGVRGHAEAGKQLLTSSQLERLKK